MLYLICFSTTYILYYLNIMKDFKTIKNELELKGIDFEVVEFTDTAISARLTDTSKNKNFNPDNSIKTLLVNTGSGMKAVILKCDDLIDQTKLKKVVGKWTVVERN